MAKGKKTGGGTRKGIPNKINAKTREALWEEIDRRVALGEEANPFMVALKMMTTEDDARLRLQCAEFLGDRLLPKLKATEITGAEGGPLQVTIMRYASASDHSA